VGIGDGWWAWCASFYSKSEATLWCYNCQLLPQHFGGHKMTRKRRSVSQTSETFSVWRTVLVEVVKFIVIGIVASIGSILVYLLTPFNELINTFFWKERAEILLISQNSSLQQGEVLNLDVFIQQ
jgi:hypothetical protein